MLHFPLVRRTPCEICLVRRKAGFEIARWKSYGIAIPVVDSPHSSQPLVVLCCGSAALILPVVGAIALIELSPSLLSCGCAMPADVGDLFLNGGNVLRNMPFLLRRGCARLPWLDVTTLLRV